MDSLFVARAGLSVVGFTDLASSFRTPGILLPYVPVGAMAITGTCVPHVTSLFKLPCPSSAMRTGRAEIHNTTLMVRMLV